MLFTYYVMHTDQYPFMSRVFASGDVRRCALLSFQASSILEWVTMMIQLLFPRHQLRIMRMDPFKLAVS
jgi:hypothetical protein